MIIVRNSLIPFGRRYAAINLLGVLFVKRNVAVSPGLINHERIHTAQMLELLVIPFYLIYLLEWMVKMVKFGGDGYRAYRALTFEREAYDNGDDPDYLSRRRHYAQWRGR